MRRILITAPYWFRIVVPHDGPIKHVKVNGPDLPGYIYAELA
jgi:hypothetical protein